MSITSLPQITAQLLAAQGLTGPDPWRLLIVGQTGTDGSAVEKTAYQDIQNLTNAQIIALFGTKSELTARIFRTLSVLNGTVSLWVIALTAASGTAATFAQTLTGTATQAGNLVVKVIDEYSYTITVSVAVGDTAAVAAQNLKTAISAITSVPCTVTGAAAALTYTANDVGTLGNKFTVLASSVPAGLVCPSGQFSAGATDPTNIATTFDNVSATRFQAIQWPWQTTYTAVKNFLEARNVINNAYLQGVAYIGYDDTEANIKTALNGVTPVNSPNLCFIGNRTVSTVSQILTPPDWRAVEFMAIEALRMTPGVAIGQYITVSSPLDTFGGPALASLAYYNTPLAKTSVTDPSPLFSQTEQNSAVADGFTVIGVNESKTSMIMGEVVTTYKFNTKGQPDVSFKYLNYIRTGYLALEIMFKSLKSDFSQYRLTQGDVIAGRAMANKNSIVADILNIFKRLGSQDFVLCQAGKDAESYFYNNLLVSIDMANGTVTASGLLPIVTQLRKINLTFQMSFTIGA